MEVLCLAKNMAERVEGSEYANLNGQLIDDWYGIRVPADKLNPNAKADPRLQKAPDGNGYLGFVGISWLTGGEGKQAPACKF